MKKNKKHLSTIRRFNSLVYDLDDIIVQMEEFMNTPEYKELLAAVNKHKLDNATLGEIDNHFLLVGNVRQVLKQVFEDHDD